MKRIVQIAIALMLFCSTLFAEVQGMTFVNSEGGFGFNLADSYTVPVNGYTGGTGIQTGYYTDRNYVGKIISTGAASVVTVEFQSSDMVFRSIQDPTKYRSVDVYICFRASGSYTGDENAYQSNSSGTAISGSSIYKNLSKTGTTTIYMPKTIGTVTGFIKSSTWTRISSYWLDIVIVLPEIDAVESEHLGAYDDYLLSLNCTFTVDGVGHNLVYNFRGYYDTSDPSTGGGEQQVLLQIVPTADGQRINLKTSSAADPTDVADVYFTVYQTGSNTTEYLMFLSASNDPTISNPEGFKFRLDGAQTFNQYNSISAAFVLMDPLDPLDMHIYDGTDTMNSLGVNSLSIASDTIIGYQADLKGYVTGTNSGTLSAGKYACPIYVHVFIDN
jgi:hypothetical protein